MKAIKNGNNTATKKRRVWGISLRTGLLGIMTASVLLLGVACTRNDKEDGTVADSNVGSVTSSTTEKNTEKSTEKMTEEVTEQESILPGTTAPGTMPVPPTTDNAETSASTTPGTTSRFGGFARGGKG
ncbi:MAG: hypothetical protein IJW90_07465 [Clostridia bacterium]|nr:hypothetical protein [Clostridia bacterium]